MNSERALLTPPRSPPSPAPGGSWTNWRRRGLGKEKLRGKRPGKEARADSGRRGPAPAGARRGSERVQRARARGRAPDVALATQSDSVAAAAARGAERAEQVRQTRGAGGGRWEDGEPQVQRARGAAPGVRSVHTPLHRDSPSTWLSGSRRRRGLEIFRGENGNYSVELRDLIRGGNANLPRVTVAGERVSL